MTTQKLEIFPSYKNSNLTDLIHINIVMIMILVYSICLRMVIIYIKN